MHKNCPKIDLSTLYFYLFLDAYIENLRHMLLPVFNNV